MLHNFRLLALACAVSTFMIAPAQSHFPAHQIAHSNAVLQLVQAAPTNVPQTDADKVKEKEKADEAAKLKAAQEQAEKEKKGIVDLKAEIYEKSLVALTMMLMLAVLLESAFAVIFNWRVFLAYFSTRGIRTLVMIVASLAVVLTFNIDIVASLIDAYKGVTTPTAPGATSKLITALILAGGSAGVNTILRALGYRSDRQEELAPKLPKDTAWLAVTVNRIQSFETATVSLVKNPTMPNPPQAIAGVITYQNPTLRSLLFRNKDRFPQNGGYVVKSDVPYTLVVDAIDAQGKPIKPQISVPIVLAPGAIVDLKFDI